jgi:hypothetical protein
LAVVDSLAGLAAVAVGVAASQAAVVVAEADEVARAADVAVAEVPPILQISPPATR